MSQSTDAPVGRWSGTVTYDGKVDEYTVDFDESGALELTTTESTGRGNWSTTGPATFTYTVKETFNLDESGAPPEKVLPGAAYVEINIDARRSGTTFEGTGTAQVRGVDGSVIYSTVAETTAQLLRV